MNEETVTLTKAKFEKIQKAADECLILRERVKEQRKHIASLTQKLLDLRTKELT